MRLVYMVPIVHDLIKHFDAVELDYINQSENRRAKNASKDASMYAMGSTIEQPDLFKLQF